MKFYTIQCGECHSGKCCSERDECLDAPLLIDLFEGIEGTGGMKLKENESREAEAMLVFRSKEMAQIAVEKLKVGDADSNPVVVEAEVKILK